MNEAPRFLLVEDDALTARSTRRAMEWAFANAKVDVCPDVVTAKRALSERPYDVVVSDFELPDGSGADVLACACALRPEAPRILVTGHTEWETATRAVNEGNAFRVVAKPWEPAQMRSLLDEALASKRARAQERRGRSDSEAARAALTEWLRGQRASIDREVARRTEGLGQALLVALDRRSPGAERRARQVALLAGWIAASVGLDEESVDDVRLAGLFHEVGSLAFTEEEARLPEAARRARASEIGASMLGAIPALRGVQRIVREAPSRFDGGDGGAPKGTEICVGARVLTVCATFVSLLAACTLDHVAHAAACRALVSDAGHALDPTLVQLLVGQPFASIRQLLDRESSR